MEKPTYPTLDEILTMNRTGLIDAFRAAQIGSIPKNASQNFLRRNLAWASQAAALGHDPVALRKSLLAKAQKATRRISVYIAELFDKSHSPTETPVGDKTVWRRGRL